MFQLRWATVALLLAFPMGTFGKVETADIRTLVSESKAIVVGAVSRIHCPNTTSCDKNAPKIAVIEQIEVVKGTGELQGRISVAFAPDEEVSAVFQEGEKVLLFLQRWDGEWTVTRGYVGKVKIEGNEAHTGLIRKEPSRQPVESLLKKVRRAK